MHQLACTSWRPDGSLFVRNDAAPACPCPLLVPQTLDVRTGRAFSACGLQPDLFTAAAALPSPASRSTSNLPSNTSTSSSHHR